MASTASAPSNHQLDPGSFIITNNNSENSQYGLDFLAHRGDRTSEDRTSIRMNNTEYQMKRRLTVKNNNANTNPNAISGVPIVSADGSVTLLQAAQLEVNFY